MGAADGGAAAAMRAAVRRLSFGAPEEKREAAGEVAALARSDERRKRLLPELGVVPPLVAMLADARGGTGARLAAAGALLELARGTHRSVGSLGVARGLLAVCMRAFLRFCSCSCYSSYAVKTRIFRAHRIFFLERKHNRWCKYLVSPSS